MATLTIELPGELARHLATLERRDEVIAQAVAQYLEDLEDIAIAEQRLANGEARNGKTYSLEEVERMIGLGTQN